MSDTGAVVHDSDLTAALVRWQLDLPAVRTPVYRAPTPRERERWHALWLLARGWPAAEAALAGATRAIEWTWPSSPAGSRSPAAHPVASRP